MQRGDVAVFSISCALAAVVVAAVTFSLLVLDRTPSSSAFESENDGSSWLVVTWGPNLCRAEPATVGCGSGRVRELGRTFVLHGLWPQPPTNQYCGVPEGLADRARDTHGSTMPPVALSDDVRTQLQSMLSDATAMSSHEWYAHGTCSGVTPDVYFGDAMALTDQVRAILDPMFRSAKDTRLTATAVRGRFDDAFGHGAGARVGLTCRNVPTEGNVVFEVRLSLPAVVDLRSPKGALPLGELLAEGPAMSPGCSQGGVA